MIEIVIQKENNGLFRKIIAVILAISFVAMSTSGLMMTFIERPSFTLKMHPVHKSFGVIMILVAIPHIYYNLPVLIKYLKEKVVFIYGLCGVVLLVGLYGLAIMKEIPHDLAEQMDSAAEQAEAE